MHLRNFARRRLWKIVHAVFGNIEYQSCPRAGRQYESIRQYDFRALARYPDIHVGIGMYDVLVAQAMSLGDINQGVIVARNHRGYFADDIMSFRRQIINCSLRGKIPYSEQGK